MESQNFQNSKSPLTFALGKDISATCKVACIDKLVHTLVAGSTNSGKSVCLNTMLVSLLYKASPEDLRLVKDGPRERRSFIDKEISQIMPKYYNYLINYNKILSQKNRELYKLQKTLI